MSEAGFNNFIFPEDQDYTLLYLHDGVLLFDMKAVDL